MVTRQDMEMGSVVAEGFVFEGEDVANVFYLVRTVRPLVGWRTTNKRRAERQMARVARVRALRAK